MRLHFGAIPSSPDFNPGTSWKELGYFLPWMEKLVVIPIGIVAAAVVAVLWFAMTPMQDLPPTMSLPAFLVSLVTIIATFGLYPNPLMSFPAFLVTFVGIVVVHELLHAAVHPKCGFSTRSTVGFWLSGGMFYAHYDGEMTRNRLLAILLLPLVVISFVPLLAAAVAQVTSGWMAFVSIFHAFLACGDMLMAGMVLFKVPANAIVRDQGGKFYWREHETLAA